MSLKARLKRLEAQVEWLEVDGMLRVCELKFELIDKERQIADHLAVNPEAAALFAAAGITFIRPTPPPPPLSRVNLVEEISSPARASEGTEGGGPQGRRGTRSSNTNIAHLKSTESLSALWAAPPAGEEVVRPSPPEPSPPALPPRRMQLSPVTRRLRDSPRDRNDSSRPEEDYYGYHADF
jgi:hypothetical protein